MNPRRLHRLVRRLTLLAVGGALAYLWLRFEVISLPEGTISPLVRIRPGSQLWVDRWASRIEGGDVVFFATPDGGLSFGEVERSAPEGDRYWIVTDAPDWPKPDSDELGWIPASSIEGRLMMATNF